MAKVAKRPTLKKKPKPRVDQRAPKRKKSARKSSARKTGASKKRPSDVIII